MREENCELHRQRVSKSLCGKFGEESRRWKGNEAGYVAKHMWILKHFGNAKRCEFNPMHVSYSRYEWANISGQHKRTIDDYVQLCPSCHRLFDGKDFCKNGHAYTGENTYINSRGHRECRICRKKSRKKWRMRNVSNN